MSTDESCCRHLLFIPYSSLQPSHPWTTSLRIVWLAQASRRLVPSLVALSTIASLSFTHFASLRSLQDVHRLRLGTLTPLRSANATLRS
ncbi:hypothetical protein EV426DRAFT_646335 [Tirmania nivea]|nr:hypothetical protein EV426DRAFT_646335 [Tirmania nivea]